jgi:NAD-dependent dihydropyrimidine dehydrogenase PreA subunit
MTAYTIKDDCTACDSCRSQCPQGAIKFEAEQEEYWIDPTLCDGCPDLEVPRCVEACSVFSLVPLRPKKGRCKSTLLPAAIPEIFLNGKTTPFASSMVIWEAYNLLAQRQHLPWQVDPAGQLYYQRPVNRGRGDIQFRLVADPESDSLMPMAANEAAATLAQFDLRAACVHLILAAYAATVDCPWEEAFGVST